jgi:hypothetical protein
MKLEFCGQIFEKKHSYITFHAKLSSRTLVVPCGRTDRHMRKLIFAFRNFTKARNKHLKKEVRFVSQPVLSLLFFEHSSDFFFCIKFCGNQFHG